MRTNIVIDDELMARAAELSGIKTKKEVVDRALRILIRHYEQREVRQLRGHLRWEGNLNEMREARLEYFG